MTKQEHDNINFIDPRYSSPIMGQSMELAYDPEHSDESTHHPERLMRQALLQCGPRFVKAGFNIGVGKHTLNFSKQGSILAAVNKHNHCLEITNFSKGYL